MMINFIRILIFEMLTIELANVFNGIRAINGWRSKSLWIVENDKCLLLFKISVILEENLILRFKMKLMRYYPKSKLKLSPNLTYNWKTIIVWINDTKNFKFVI